VIGRDGVFVTATCYDLDGAGIESRGGGGGENFRPRPDWPRGPPIFLYNEQGVSWLNFTFYQYLCTTSAEVNLFLIMIIC
jgi:hypothetical protein